MAKLKNSKDISKGDIVQVDPEKYPEFAWMYLTVKKVTEHNVDNTMKIKAAVLELKPVNDNKKSIKKAQKINKELSQKLIHILDLELMVPREETTGQ